MLLSNTRGKYEGKIKIEQFQSKVVKKGIIYMAKNMTFGVNYLETAQAAV